ncbi:M1 family metallopeptidase [Sphingobacterium thalpophilum]|uniref:Peptidase M1 membrane alanine aminopeptidase domain-containing protein n=1 Tax=Sphingobacterium thalpophilum TaxID=259 RepID=A0A4U9UAA9_9SPHI|nr:M1 family metallopeptidase [Sphingobacterium thalpophilum]VTR29846.1 Uncharacterised protein [Sphingobacterium thalpophilum]
MIKSTIRYCSMALLLSAGYAQAQDLYTPRNIRVAMEKGTRTANGAPGKKYWQNFGKYNISFRLDPAKRKVTGSETIQYANNSPDTLTKLAIRFVNNVHKPNAVRANYASDDYLTSGLKITSLKLNGQAYQVNSQDWGTVKLTDFAQKMLPGSISTLEISWEYPLSAESDRDGMLNESTFYCAYAYPRVSVYDDYNGWDLLEHNGRQEFYNDFNDYQVTITVPKNFVVWATGELQNAAEVLQQPILARFEKSKHTDAVIHVATAAEMKAGKVTAQHEWNSWKFKASYVPDFCFSVSDNYIWDASSVDLGSKRVSVQSSYVAGTPDFEQYIGWQQYCIEWFSNNWPGVTYPYPTMTAVQGFADMEYPMMINDSSVPDNFVDARQTADHEIAHTYFPFYMGINETRYGYMDEGWATALEYWIGNAEIGEEKNKELFKDSRVKRYIFDPSAEEDQPLITMTSQLNGLGYGNNAYIKAALSYIALRDYLGDMVFKKALHHYMDLWHGKHPTPWDFFYSINAGAGQNLNWFWKNWYFSNHYIDLKVDSFDQSGHNKKLTIANVGGFAVPFEVKITYADGSVETKHQTPAIWQQDEKRAIITWTSSKKVQNITLDGGVFMDYTAKDNSWQNVD